MEGIQQTTYTASAIAHIFNNSLQSEALKNIIDVKGIYVPGRGQNYGGVYYDQLKEEASDACITLIVPALIRAELAPQQSIECAAVITKKVNVNGAKIELQVNMLELISQKESEFTSDQIEALKLLQRKAASGYKDVDTFLKTKIIRNEPLRIIILIGKSGIIDHDIRHQLEETISFYDFEFIRINLSSEKEIIDAMKTHHSSTDLLIVSRGGGDRLEIFNKPSIAEAALSLACHFVTAIGHQQDNTLLQQVADKAFITPTSLGQYFNDIYNRTIEELQNSKAHITENITKQLEGNYLKQITNLEEQMKAREALHVQSLANTESLHKKEIELLKDQKPNVALYWILVIAAAIIGLLAGLFFK